MNPPADTDTDTDTEPGRAAPAWSVGVTFTGDDPAVALVAGATAPNDQHRGSA